MPISVRLDIQTEALMNRLARRRGRTKSEIIREALATLAQREEDLDRAATPYERMASHLGCASGGPSELSERTGRRFGQYLRSKVKS